MNKIYQQIERSMSRLRFTKHAHFFVARMNQGTWNGFPVWIETAYGSARVVVDNTLEDGQVVVDVEE